MQRGGNVSLSHVDFMIGSSRMDIDGITGQGAREPVMRKGNGPSTPDPHGFSHTPAEDPAGVFFINRYNCSMPTKKSPQSMN